MSAPNSSPYHPFSEFVYMLEIYIGVIWVLSDFLLWTALVIGFLLASIKLKVALAICLLKKLSRLFLYLIFVMDLLLLKVILYPCHKHSHHKVLA